MFFKNAIIYQIIDSIDEILINIDTLLAEHQFTPCKSQESSRYGWITPHKAIDTLHLQAMGVFLIKAQKEEKVLPSSVVNQQLKDKVAVIEKQETRKVYAKEKANIKDEIILDMLPRAFSTFSETQAMILPDAGLLIVDASTHAKAEELLNLLRNSFNSLPIKLPDTNDSPSVIMSQWLNQENLLPEFKCLERCQLNDQGSSGSIIRVTGQELHCDEITIHLEAGKAAVALELEWNEALSFLLKEDLSLKQIKPTDSFATEMNEENSEDPLARLDADLVLISSNFKRLAPQIFNAFGGLVRIDEKTANHKT